MARIQALPWSNSHFTLFGRLSAQHAGMNLDSSADFGPGGATGVRAYPSGAAFGDAGWLTQIELRYSAGVYAPCLLRCGRQHHQHQSLGRAGRQAAHLAALTSF